MNEDNKETLDLIRQLREVRNEAISAVNAKIAEGEQRLNRKPIQIAIGRRQDEDNEVVDGDRIYALCDDGSIWYSDMLPTSDEWAWWTMHTVPQGPREDIGDAFERP